VKSGELKLVQSDYLTQLGKWKPFVFPFENNFYNKYGPTTASSPRKRERTARRKFTENIRVERNRRSSPTIYLLS